MQFDSSVRLLIEPIKSARLSDVWTFKDEELSEIAKRTIAKIESEGSVFFHLANRAALYTQCILEFQDLIGMPFPRHGRSVNTNYLFFEGLAALREATLSGYSGMVHASFATLRSAYEMFALHDWWRERLFFADSHEGYYDWLEKRTKSPPFKNILRENFKNFSPSPSLTSFDKSFELYEFLCIYSHRPVLEESTTRLRGGNLGLLFSDELLEFWLNRLEFATRNFLEHMIAARPECLFPVELTSKFGFNPPAGLFFDNFNWNALESAFEKSPLLELQEYYREHKTVQSLMDWLKTWPDLSDEQILESWDDEEDKRNDSHLSVSKRIIMRVAVMKAKARAINWRFAYGSAQMAQDLALPKIQL